MNLFDIDARIHVQNIDEVTEKLERISELLKEIRKDLLQLGFGPMQDDYAVSSHRGTDDLPDVPTCELVKELKKREGVEAHEIGPTASIKVKADGPAIVFVVID